MDLNSRRKKLLEILNYIAEQEKIIKLSNTSEYQRFVEWMENRKRFINTYTSENIDGLTESFEKLIKAFEKKDKKLISIIEEGLIKASMHSENQKFGSEPIPGQLSFALIENRELVRKAKNLNITITGWDLTRAEDMAIFAIQKLYSKYGFINKDNNDLAFPHTEYYEAYGVKKWKNKKGEIVFSGSGKSQAIQALLSLSTRQCIVVYNQLNIEATKRKGKKIFRRIEHMSSIIPELDLCYEGLNETEFYNGKRKINKLVAIYIRPANVLFDQIEDHYILQPSNFYTEMKEKLPGVKNKHLPMFIHWLATKIAIRREEALRKRKDLNSIIEISFEKLSYKLRMDIWIKAGQQKRINDRLMECFKQAKTLGYLNWYRTGSGKTVTKKVTLQINADKFKPHRNVEEIIYNNPEEEYTYKPISEESKRKALEIMAKFSIKHRKKLEGLEGDL
jgi:hypothetical protein